MAAKSTTTKSTAPPTTKPAISPLGSGSAGEQKVKPVTYNIDTMSCKRT